MKVLTGLDCLVAEEFGRLRGLRVGVLAHPASVDRRCRHIVPLLRAAGTAPVALFGPEHGLDGAAQDMEAVEDGSPSKAGDAPRVYSLYGSTEASLRPTSDMLDGLDVLVVDLQDVGARYYTYVATMGFAMQTAAEVGTRVIVLDRPNPLGGMSEHIEGPDVLPSHRSFVGAFSTPIRHGLTMGEYAEWLRRTENIDVDLEVVQMMGWARSMDFEATGLPWVMPSPNMPTTQTAWVYPGQCLLEGTNLSEGRGTTRPFELCGAPWLRGGAWAEAAEPDVGAGFVLRPTVIKPMFQKHARQSCGGLQVHVSDRWKARSLRLSVALIAAARRLAREHFAWRTDAYEFVSDRLAIDVLFGSSVPRGMIEEGASVHEVLETFRGAEQEFREARKPALLYPEG